MKKGKIIWLNGVSSSEKSTLAIRLQKNLPSPYFCIAMDTFTDVIAPWLSGNFNGIEADDLWYTAVRAMNHTIKLYSDLGLNVIVDHVVLNQDDGKEQLLHDDFVEMLSDYPLILVQVTCGIDELKRREMERGDREIGNAEWQVKKGLYPSEGYAVVVDTSLSSTEECAAVICDFAQTMHVNQTVHNITK